MIADTALVGELFNDLLAAASCIFTQLRNLPLR